MAEQDSSVLVAIPSANDYVWQISSEKVPHMTLLYMKDLSSNPNLDRIVSFLQHAAETSLYRFELAVDHRGTLGPKEADVVFFNKRDAHFIDQFRNVLLQAPDLSDAWHATAQYDEWTPHLTLGYPTAPARPDTRGYPFIDWVRFDRLALWTGNFSGPEFELQNQDRGLLMSTAEEILQHHGVKGMKWGVRKDDPGGSSISALAKAGKTAAVNEAKARTGTEVIVRNRPGEGVRTVGGNKQLAHPDAVKVRTSEQIVKRSTTDAISTKDLQELVNRMNLEAQYRTLASRETRTTAGEQYANDLLVKTGSTVASKAGLGSGTAKALQDMITKHSPNSNKALAGGKIKGDGNNQN